MRRRSKNLATYEEITERLRDTDDQLGALVSHEAAVARNLERDGDDGARAEAERKFLREFDAFVAATRSAREYMRVASDVSGVANWFRERLASEPALTEFYRLFANQTVHQYRPRLEKLTNKVQIVAEPGAKLISAPGGGLMPNRMRVTGIVDARYFYTLDGLEHDAEAAYAQLGKQYPNEGVVQLSLRYGHLLKQILKSAQRKGRFDGPKP